MPMILPSLQVFRSLTPDGWLLFGTRCARLFAFGLLTVVLTLYLRDVGLDADQIGALLTLTLLGDLVVSLWITTRADRVGRKQMLILGALLMVVAAVPLATTDNFWLLLPAATIGVLSPNANEVGPFLAIEQAALTQTVPATQRTQIFAWYHLVGALSAALGALCAGLLTGLARASGLDGADSYRPAVIVYGVIGVLLALAFTRLSPAAEAPVAAHAPPPARTRFSLHRSRGIVFGLSCLFALDAFGGGLVMQTLIADWFSIRFAEDPETIGAILSAANLLAGLSALAAAEVARRVGLLNTMILTHLPSNILLILVPLMPNLELAIAVLLLRFSLSQMDVPTRQSYTLAVVSPDERSAAAGVTNVARSVGAAASPYLASVLFAQPALISVPFFLAGGVKIVYDLLLYRSFRTLRPPEEQTAAPEKR